MHGKISSIGGRTRREYQPRDSAFQRRKEHIAFLLAQAEGQPLFAPGASTAAGGQLESPQPQHSLQALAALVDKGLQNRAICSRLSWESTKGTSNRSPLFQLFRLSANLTLTVSAFIFFSSLSGHVQRGNKKAFGPYETGRRLCFRSTTHYNIPTYAPRITAGNRHHLLREHPVQPATPEGSSAMDYSHRAPTVPGSLGLSYQSVLSLSKSFLV